MPPLACNVAEYAVLIFPDARLVVVMLNCVEEIVSVYDVDLLCAGLPLSVTVAVKVKVPAAVGVPEIRPEDASVWPVGRLPDVRLQT